MKATKQNYKLVNQITKLLSDAGCTVKDATDILIYTSKEIVANSKVQMTENELAN